MDRKKGKTEQANSGISSQLASVFHANASGGNKITMLSEHDVTNKLFSDEQMIGKLIFGYLANGQSDGIDLKTFQSSAEPIFNKGTDSKLVEFYFGLFSMGKPEMVLSDVQAMLYICHRTDWINLGISVQSYPSRSRDPILEAIASSLFVREATSVTQEKLLKWCSTNCPRCLTGLHSLVCSRLTEGNTASAGAPLFTASTRDDSLLQSCQNGRSISTLSIVWHLSCFLPGVYFPEVECDGAALATNSNLLKAVHPAGWQVIYNSGNQGLSTNRFKHHVMDYNGSSLVLIAFDKFVFVVGVDQKWRESSKSWGGPQCYILQFQPTYSVLGSGPDLIYFNLVDRTAPRYLQFGKERSMSIKIDADFEKVAFFGVDYRLKALEVWGGGGQSARDAQLRLKAWEEQDIKKHQNRKLVPEEWKNNADREILEMAGITTDHNQRSDI